MREAAKNTRTFFESLNHAKRELQKLYEEYPELTALTRRELEIFGELLSNLTMKEIAEAKKISASSVHYHCKNIYRKLNLSSRRQLLMTYKDLYE